MRLTTCLVIIALMPVLVVPALAGQGATVGIGSTKIITVAPVHGMTLAQRAAALHARLVDILTVLRAGQDPGVRVEVEQAGPVIMVKGIRFITVTLADGRLHNSTPLCLARLWAERLTEILPEIAPVNAPEDILTPALARPRVSITRDPSFAAVQPGERRFSITVTAPEDRGDRLIQVTKRDNDGLAVVAGERLGHGRTHSVSLVTRGSVIFEVFQDGTLVYREHLPLSRRQ